MSVGPSSHWVPYSPPAPMELGWSVPWVHFCAREDTDAHTCTNTHTHKQVSHLESGFTLDSQLRFCLPAYKMGAVTELTRHPPGTQLTTTCMAAEALGWHMELSSCPLGLFLQVALELLRPVT